MAMPETVDYMYICQMRKKSELTLPIRAPSPPYILAFACKYMSTFTLIDVEMENSTNRGNANAVSDQ